MKRDAQGVVQLSPLRFTFDANELRLPVRLGLLNAGGKQDLIVYVIHPTSRFEVANYANIFIPTNLEVADGVRNNFPAFYAELFDATVEKMGRKAVVTEYAWQTTGCDPCPTPPLPPTIWRRWASTSLEGARRDGARERAARRRDLRRRPSWVLTRLHARYSKETLSEDLIFREAKPAMGGRANWNGTNGDEGASVSRRRRRRQQLPGPLHHPPLLERTGRLQEPALRPVGRPARQPGRAPDADRGQGAGDRAAREGRADDGGALAGAAAGHPGQAAARRRK